MINHVLSELNSTALFHDSLFPEENYGGNNMEEELFYILLCWLMCT